MQRYTVEILQVSPSNLLHSLEAAYAGKVVLEAHFLRTDAIAAYTPHTRLGNGVFDIRSPHAADDVRISLCLSDAALATPSAGLHHPPRHILASCRQLVSMGAPSRAHGACWVALHATTARGAMVDTAPEVGKVQLMWSVSPLPFVSATSPQRMDNTACTGSCACACTGPVPRGCTPHARGCLCDMRSGAVPVHCPHCPLHRLDTAPALASARADMNDDDAALRDAERRQSALSAASRTSFVSQDVALDVSSVSGGRAIAGLPTLGSDAFDQPPFSAAAQCISTQTSSLFPPAGAAETGLSAAVHHTTTEGTTAAHAVPPFSLAGADAARPPTTAAVTTARWTESGAAGPSQDADEPLAGTHNAFEPTPSPSPLRADRTLRHSEPSSVSPAATEAALSESPSLSSPAPQTYTVGQNIVYVGNAAPDDHWLAAMNADPTAAMSSDPGYNRRELNQLLLQSFPRSEVIFDGSTGGAGPVEVLGSSATCDPACGTGPHIEYYATSTQVDIPISRAVKNLYTRPSPIVHLAADRAEYTALRVALQNTEGLEQLYVSCRPGNGRSRTRWLHDSALESIRTERAGHAEAGRPPVSVDYVRDRLDMLMAFTEAERTMTSLATTPEQEATLDILKDHAMRGLMRTAVQYGVA